MSARRENRAVLLSAVALNWAGAAKLARESWLVDARVTEPTDYVQLKLFTAGTAATFGAFYLYLHLRREPPFPLLIFGASLKMWALATSTVLWVRGRLDRRNFVTFGVSNGLVGAAMWVHIARAARGARGR